jgi:hypothetical protein
VAAFAPDAGESVSSIVANAAPGTPGLPIVPSADGDLTHDRTRFPGLFATNVAPATARFMADSQQPWGAKALTDAVGARPCETKPSWYLVAGDNRITPPSAQHGMARRAGATIEEARGSHAVYVASPAALAALIDKAAGAGKTRK